MAGLTFGANCPPGFYSPGVFQDCRPIVNPQVIQQQQLSQIATPAYYAPEGATQAPYEIRRPDPGAQPTAQPSQPIYYQQAPMGSSGGGFDVTTLLLIGLAVFLLVKK